MNTCKKDRFKDDSQMIADEELRNHWVVQPMDSPWQLNVTKYRFIETILFIKEHIDKERMQIFVADIGDTDGLLIRKLGCKGIGINIAKECARNIFKNNIPGLVGNAECVPLKSKSVDYAFCFETIEHVENPVSTLRELKRVSRKGIFLSIPFTSRTRVREAGYSLMDTRENQHIFEFCEKDFINVLTHVNLEVTAKKFIFNKPAVTILNLNIHPPFLLKKLWIVFFLTEIKDKGSII